MADETFGKRDEKNLIRKMMKQLLADMPRTDRYEKYMQILEKIIKYFGINNRKNIY